jgi:signal peptidase II
MAYRSFRNWLIAIALLGVMVDQAGKYVVFYWLYQPTHFDPNRLQGEYQIVPGAFRLHVQYTPTTAEGYLRTLSADKLPHVNRGALFGFGNAGGGLFGKQVQVGPDDANYFFAFISIAAGMAITVWSFWRRTPGERLLCIALGLILAGTIGNLYDRLVFGGVRDFLYFHLIDWPVFNLADCCLVVGAFLLLSQAFLTQKAQNTAAAKLTEAVPQPAVSAPQVASIG